MYYSLHSGLITQCIPLNNHPVIEFFQHPIFCYPTGCSLKVYWDFSEIYINTNDFIHKGHSRLIWSHDKITWMRLLHIGVYQQNYVEGLQKYHTGQQLHQLVQCGKSITLNITNFQISQYWYQYQCLLCHLITLAPQACRTSAVNTGNTIGMTFALYYYSVSVSVQQCWFVIVI